MTGRLELGAAPIGNLYREVSDEQAHATLQAAWDAGIRAFDTAPHYGIGLSERRLGAFLQTVPREEFTVSTKVGRLLEPQEPTGDDMANGFAVPDAHRRVWRLDEAGIRQSLEESLTRLGLDRVDVVYLHDPDESPLPEREAVDQGLTALAALRSEGLTGRIGVGSKSESALAAALEHDVDQLMCSNRWTLVDRQAGERVLPAALARGAEVVAVSVLSSGLLARPRPQADSHDEYGPVRPERLALAERLADIAERHGVDLPTLAMHYPLRHPAVTAIAVGAGRPAHVQDAARRMTTEIPDAAWAEVDEVDVAV